MSKQERAARTRNALIHSAAERFERHGYVKASLDEISSGAGVSRGALHFHFENKAAVAEAVESAAACFLRVEVSRAAPEGANALQVLMDVSHTLARVLGGNVVVRAGFQLNCTSGPHSGHDFRKQWQICVRRLVTRAKAEKTLAAGVSGQALVSTVVAATVGLETLGRVGGEWLSHQSLTSFWRLLLPSVAAPEELAALNPRGSAAAPGDQGGAPREGTAVSAPRLFRARAPRQWNAADAGCHPAARASS